MKRNFERIEKELVIPAGTEAFTYVYSPRFVLDAYVHRMDVIIDDQNGNTLIVNLFDEDGVSLLNFGSSASSRTDESLAVATDGFCYLGANFALVPDEDLHIKIVLIVE